MPIPRIRPEVSEFGYSGQDYREINAKLCERIGKLERELFALKSALYSDANAPPKALCLTAVESRVFCLLLPGQVLGIRQISEALGGEKSDRTMYWYLGNLRRKLKGSGFTLRTWRDVGYQLGGAWNGQGRGRGPRPV